LLPAELPWCPISLFKNPSTVEHLPGKCKALSSNPRTANKTTTVNKNRFPTKYLDDKIFKI
jgi:hypothetical protein